MEVEQTSSPRDNGIEASQPVLKSLSTESRWSTKVEPPNSPRDIPLDDELQTDTPAALSNSEAATRAGGNNELGQADGGSENLRAHLRQAISAAVENETLEDLLRQAWRADASSAPPHPPPPDSAPAQQVQDGATRDEVSPSADLPQQQRWLSEMERQLQDMHTKLDEVSEQKTQVHDRLKEVHNQVHHTHSKIGEATLCQKAPLQVPSQPISQPVNSQTDAPPPPNGAWIPEVETLRSETVALRDRTEKLEAMLMKLMADR